MTDLNNIRDNLDYVSSAVRSGPSRGGIPALYFLWGLLIFIGFTLADFAPQLTGFYFLIVGPAGGLFSWWLGARTGRREGVNDAALGQRYGLHWLVSGAAFLLAFISLISAREAAGPELFLLVAGLSYSLAGVHLERPLLYSGLLMLACYGGMVLISPPYAWTLTGLVVGISLLWAGFAQRAEHHRERSQ
ncbi:hypothetical protein [Microbulbifer spongiae]|uniref:DUF2157 domain-containing protein n=1 Tax=Microbulbifer spongiae TaxID=2944933 RepID=A0ABY9E9E2_9GAMM|nr:hypothetical protein [Microbulbifer sp. MI-G]WKD49633.1 hypothetical protein M8T91_17350 [Microbulbifer sp. MI-G]